MNEEKALSEDELEEVSGGAGVPWSDRRCSECGASEKKVALRNAEGPDERGLWGYNSKLLCPRCFETYYKPKGWEWLPY